MESFLIFLLYACHVIIGEVHHSIWVKAICGINILWAFTQVICCPFVCQYHFHEHRIKSYLSVLIEEGPFNFIRDDVSPVLLKIGFS